MSGRGFPIYVKCPMHGWTAYPSGRVCSGCEICVEDHPESLWFTSKAAVRIYERERREAAELARPPASRVLFARAEIKRLLMAGIVPYHGGLAWRDHIGRGGTAAA